MKVLILEDDNNKKQAISTILKAEFPEIEIDHSLYFASFVKKVSQKEYDLIIADLLVPYHADGHEPLNATEDIISTLRDPECMNFATPVIALTLFSEVAEENYQKFHRVDFTLIHYSEELSDWSNAFLLKARKCVPKKTYDFVIFCALEKEADAFGNLGYDVGVNSHQSGLSCRSIRVGKNTGVIIVPPRMGLVNAAITCSRAIDLFEPRLICMSGICAGVEGKVNIYDVIISEMCHQHDSGKWTGSGFVPELWSVQIPHDIHLKIREIVAQKSFLEALKKDIVLKKCEFPPDVDELIFNIKIAPTSSGSSVIADERALESIRAQHRKMASFEMESFALYEAARQSEKHPMFFSAKSVVDNGDSLKSDDFHNVACKLAARTVYELIYKILD